MANNEINTGKMKANEYVVSYQQNGYGACTPVINGTPAPMLTFGYVAEADREAALKLIADALKATEGDISAVASYIYEAMIVTAAGINAQEADEVDGQEIIIDYEDRKAYIRTIEVANLDDMSCDLPREAVKAILKERVHNYIEAKEREWEEFLSAFDI